MLSLRGPEFESGDGRLPPIRQEDDPLFQRKDYRENEYMRSESRLSINSPERFVKTRLSASRSSSVGPEDCFFIFHLRSKKQCL